MPFRSATLLAHTHGEFKEGREKWEGALSIPLFHHICAGRMIYAALVSLLSVSLVNIVPPNFWHIQKVSSWQTELLLIWSDYACTLSSLLVEAASKRNTYFLCSFFLFFFWSIHFYLKDTRWHNQIKLESWLLFAKKEKKSSCSIRGNKCWTWDSHTAYYPWTHSFCKCRLFTRRLLITGY